MYSVCLSVIQWKYMFHKQCIYTLQYVFFIFETIKMLMYIDICVRRCLCFTNSNGINSLEVKKWTHYDLDHDFSFFAIGLQLIALVSTDFYVLVVSLLSGMRTLLEFKRHAQYGWYIVVELAYYKAIIRIGRQFRHQKSLRFIRR